MKRSKAARGPTKNFVTVAAFYVCHISLTVLIAAHIHLCTLQEIATALQLGKWFLCE